MTSFVHDPMSWLPAVRSMAPLSYSPTIPEMELGTSSALVLVALYFFTTRAQPSKSLYMLTVPAALAVTVHFDALVSACFWAMTALFFTIFSFRTLIIGVIYGHDAFENHIMNMPCTLPNKNVSAFRQKHVDQPFTLKGHVVNNSNTHSNAAQRRSAARHWIDTAISYDGRVNYAINCSNSDLRKGAEGDRKIRTAKDAVYYNETRNDTPSSRHHYSSIDDLDWFTNQQMSDLLRKSIDDDNTIYSYVHRPTSACFRTDEFTVNYNDTTQKWKFKCADEDSYDQELWDNNSSIVSHISLGSITRRKQLTILTLTIIFMFVLHHVIARNTPLSVTTPFGTFCYDWFELTWYKFSFFEIPPDYQVNIGFRSGAQLYTLPSIWSFVPDWGRVTLVHNMIDYPWTVACPDYYARYAFTLMSGIVFYAISIILLMAAGLRSGFHFTFHIDCDSNRSIWICHPVVRFGAVRTLYYIASIVKLLPKRLQPSIVQTPPSPLEDIGVKIHAFTHIDQETSQRLYTYNLAGANRTTVFDELAYNLVKSHNLSAKAKISVSQFCIAYGSEFKDKWTTDQITVGINAVTYESGHTEVIDCMRPPSVTNYRFRPDDYVEEEKESTLKGFFPGATRGCTYIAQSSRGNTQHGIQTRITDVKPQGIASVTNRYQQRNIVSFLNEYKKDIGHIKARMLTPDEVYERQAKVTQRQTNAEAMSHRPSDWLDFTSIIGKATRSFQKTEAGMKPSDPRNITPMPPTVRLQNSRISLALASNMKKTKWYAFGLTPNEVAARVAGHVSDARTRAIALGDYSRMDGTITKLIREFDLAFLHSNFEQKDHEEIDTWYEMTYGNKVNAGMGVHYDQDTSQASGDPYTSALNTARNSFISYCCLLASPIPGTSDRISEAGAYKNLGLMAGDDSIQRNLDAARSITTAASWGFTLKFVMARRGDPVDFLARNYSPAVWIGGTDNVCSPLRMISKFHVSSLSDTVPHNVIAHTKARSILANDSETYIVGDWMRKIVEQTQLEYDAYCGKKPKSLALLNNERQWNDRWASTHGDIKETSYQVGNTMDHDWQIALFLKEFESERIDEFDLFLQDPTSIWNENPVLLQSNAKPAAQTYMGNGVLVDPLTTAQQEQKHDKPTIDLKQADASGKTAATPTEAGSRIFCKRATNTRGWYEGLAPCYEPVKVLGKYCRTCNDIFVAARKSKPPSSDSDGGEK
jgi:hypothetical protein